MSASPSFEPWWNPALLAAMLVDEKQTFTDGGITFRKLRRPHPEPNSGQIISWSYLPLLFLLELPWEELFHADLFGKLQISFYSGTWETPRVRQERVSFPESSGLCRQEMVVHHGWGVGLAPLLRTAAGEETGPARRTYVVSMGPGQGDCHRMIGIQNYAPWDWCLFHSFQLGGWSLVPIVGENFPDYELLWSGVFKTSL